MMIGNAPRPRIEIEAGVELALLRRAAELRVDVAAPERPVPSARTGVVLEHAHLVAGVLKLDRRGHSGEAGPQNDDRCALGIAVELDRASVRQFLRVSEASHRLVGGRSADARADDLKQSSPAKSRRRRVAHRSVLCFIKGGIVASSNEARKAAKVRRDESALQMDQPRPRASRRGAAASKGLPRACRGDVRLCAKAEATRWSILRDAPPAILRTRV